MRTVENEMTEYPSIASPEMTVTEAAEYMAKYKIRHLPVVDKGKVIGVVSERDLRQAEILADAMTMLVTDVMAPDPYCVPVGTSLATVAREMAKKKYGCTVILNRLGRVVGIFTTTDGMRVLSGLLDSKGNPDFGLVGIETVVDRSFATN
ncbi:MAG: CBS domain-containing protein [Oligoflexia bacterium]|nr:CBS domain-containing protein [Oligoflexia bacterium]